MSGVWLEDLAEGLQRPRVGGVETDESLWRNGIGQENFDHVIRELNAFELMWGHGHEQGGLAKAFLGIPPALA